MSANQITDQPSPKPLRWIRFRLRALLVVITIFCITLGYLVSKARQQSLAVQALERTNAVIAYDYQFDQSLPTPFQEDAESWVPEFALNAFGRDMFHSVVAVGWEGYRHSKLAVKNSDIELLATLNEVIWIELLSDYVSSQELATIRQATNLRYLQLELEIPLGKQELEELKKFTHLETLILATYAPVSESQLRELRSSLPHTDISWDQILSFELDPNFKLSP